MRCLMSRFVSLSIARSRIPHVGLIHSGSVSRSYSVPFCTSFQYGASQLSKCQPRSAHVSSSAVPPLLHVRTRSTMIPRHFVVSPPPSTFGLRIDSLIVCPLTNLSR